VRIVAPLRIEALAVGGTRIGLGARRPLPPGPVLLAGVAGAVTSALAPGDIVVADRILPPPATPVPDPRIGGGSGSGARGDRALEVAAGAEEVLLAGAGELARVLRIAGLTVHVGAVGGADGIVTGAARDEWAARGVLAVDMESGAVARTGQLAAVVRAVVDTPVHPLVSFGTVPRGTAALRSLRRAAPVLSAWAAGRGTSDVRERQAAPVDITITLPGEVEDS
jgi:4-hydroxy-3-methylbut-2-enyl diphosphate reductase